MDDLSEREQRLAALEAMCRDEMSEQLTIERLDGLLATWQESGHSPEGVRGFSSGEYSALVLASSQEKRLESPSARSSCWTDGCSGGSSRLWASPPSSEHASGPGPIADSNPRQRRGFFFAGRARGRPILRSIRSTRLGRAPRLSLRRSPFPRPRTRLHRVPAGP